jgi:transposase
MMSLAEVDLGFPDWCESDSTCWLEERMGKPYSLDLHERVVGAIEKGGLSRRRAAAHFDVGISTVILWVRRFRESGSVAAGQMGGHKPKAIRGEQRTWLLTRAQEKDFTLRGLVAELAERGLKVDSRTVWNFVHAEKLSFKKTVAASEQDRPDIARRRAQWTKYQRRIAPERLVFIDETGTKTTMAPLRGGRRAAQGQGPPWPLENHDVPGRPAP